MQEQAGGPSTFTPLACRQPPPPSEGPCVQSFPSGSRQSWACSLPILQRRKLRLTGRLQRVCQRRVRKPATRTLGPGSSQVQRQLRQPPGKRPVVWPESGLGHSQGATPAPGASPPDPLPTDLRAPGIWCVMSCALAECGKALPWGGGQRGAGGSGGPQAGEARGPGAGKFLQQFSHL